MSYGVGQRMWMLRSEGCRGERMGSDDLDSKQSKENATIITRQVCLWSKWEENKQKWGGNRIEDNGLRANKINLWLIFASF